MKLKYYLKNIIHRIKYKGICYIGYNSNISTKSSFEGMNRVCAYSHFDGHLGYGSYVSAHCDIAMTKIGRFTSIGPRVVVNPGRHPYTYPYVTTSPAFFSCMKQNSGTFVEENFYNEFNYVDKNKQFVVNIGNDCWIGEGVFIAGGVTIGDGAVVLAHAVVTKDIEPYSIVGGVPAKHIKYRYSNDDIAYLMDFKWWNKDIAWLKSHADLLRNFEKMKEYINEKRKK